MRLDALRRLVNAARPRNPTRDGKVVAGKNGVLFIDNDSNGVMEQITGRTRLSARTQAEIRHLHAERTDICAASGIAYRHVVCPNKESVATSDLPDRYRFESDGPTVMSHYVRRFGPDSPFYDRILLQGLPAPYYRTDSHWTSAGALAYLRAALAHFGDPRVLQRLDELRIDEVAQDRVGDLGMKLDNRPERCVFLHLPQRSARIVFEANMTGDGHVRLERCDVPVVAGTKALVLHDSFAEPLYVFLAECYAETLFVRAPHFDADFVSRYRPDIVWFLQAERFFPRVPKNGIDLPAWIAAQERRKKSPVHGSAFARQIVG